MPSWLELPPGCLQDGPKECLLVAGDDYTVLNGHRINLPLHELAMRWSIAVSWGAPSGHARVRD